MHKFGITGSVRPWQGLGKPCVRGRQRRQLRSGVCAWVGCQSQLARSERGGGGLSPGQTYRDKLRLGACEISLHGRDVSSPARLPGEGEWQSGKHHRNRNLFQVAQRGGLATATTMKYRGGPGVREKLRRQDDQAWGACSMTSDGRVISWVEGGCSRSGAQGREEAEGSTGAAALNSKRTKPTPQRSPQVLRERQEGGAGAQGRHAQCGIPRLF